MKMNSDNSESMNNLKAMSLWQKFSSGNQTTINLVSQKSEGIGEKT